MLVPLYFMLFPLTDAMEKSLSLHWEIIPKVVVGFSTDSPSVIGQFHQIDDLPAPTIVPTPFPNGTTLLLSEEGGVRVAKNKYFGGSISFVYASQLRNLRVDDSVGGGQEPSVCHKAIKAFLDTLPDDTRIALWWE